MNAWWNVTKFAPQITRQVSSIMAIYMGVQPRGMQHNFERRVCQICPAYDADTPIHILFVCEGLGHIREKYWRRVISSMPQAMQIQIEEMNFSSKMEMFLSCLHGSCIPEWDALYISIANFIHNVYCERSRIYNSLTVSE